jgi:CRP-like cAMP-binding protein
MIHEDRRPRAGFAGGQVTKQLQSWSALFESGELGASVVMEDRAIVAQKGASAGTAWFHSRGLLEVFQTNHQGASYLARILVAPNLVCLKECVAGRERYLQTVRVLESAALVPLPREPALRILERHPRVCLSTLVEVTRAFCGAVSLEANRMETIESLLANVILAYTRSCGESWDRGTRMRVKRTQEDLAEAVGGNERSVNRVLARWKKEELVDKRDARYLVFEAERLKSFVSRGVGDLVHYGEA